jgi:hypothetical protein
MKNEWKDVGLVIDVKDLKVGKFYRASNDVFEFLHFDGEYPLFKPIKVDTGYDARQDGSIGFARWGFPNQEVVKI